MCRTHCVLVKASWGEWELLGGCVKLEVWVNGHSVSPPSVPLPTATVCFKLCPCQQFLKLWPKMFLVAVLVCELYHDKIVKHCLRPM